MSSTEYSINLGCWRSVFAVPTELTDKYLRMAGCSQLKVILYLLRNCSRSVSIDELAVCAGISIGDAEDAVRYWLDTGLIANHEGEPGLERLIPSPVTPDHSERLNPIQENTQSASVAAEPLPSIGVSQPPKQTVGTTGEVQSEQSKAPVPKRREHIRYSHDECSAILTSKPELSQMLAVLEGLMQKQLNFTELSVFVTLVEYYGLPSGCVAMLVEYCRSIGKGSISYIEQTGIGWSNESIDTIEKADAKIKRLTMLRTAWNKVRTALDIAERKPSAKEEQFCDRWINELGLNIDLVKLAFDRCIDSKGKTSFSYMNGILTRWHGKGILTVEQAQKEEAPTTAKASRKEDKNGRFAPTYDLDDIERMLDEEWNED